MSDHEDKTILVVEAFRYTGVVGLWWFPLWVWRWQDGRTNGVSIRLGPLGLSLRRTR